MSTMKRTDGVIPELLAEAIQGEFAGMTLLNGTGVAVQSSTLPVAARGGDRIKVPYFGTMGEVEDIDNEGDALTPEPLSMSSEEALVRHSGKAFEISEWARMALEYADPYAEAARQFTEIVKRRVDKALIDVATTSLDASYIKDVYNAVTPKTLDYDTMIAAKTLWGDEQENISLLGVHSKVNADLLKLKYASGEPQLVSPTDANLVARFCGVPVRVSDKCKVTTDTPPKYESIIAKRAALAFWFARTPEVLPYEDPLAHTKGFAVHFYWVAYRYKRVRGGTRPGIVKVVTN